LNRDPRKQIAKQELGLYSYQSEVESGDSRKQVAQ